MGVCAKKMRHVGLNSLLNYCIICWMSTDTLFISPYHMSACLRVLVNRGRARVDLRRCRPYYRNRARAELDSNLHPGLGQIPSVSKHIFCVFRYQTKNQKPKKSKTYARNVHGSMNAEKTEKQSWQRTKKKEAKKYEKKIQTTRFKIIISRWLAVIYRYKLLGCGLKMVNADRSATHTGGHTRQRSRATNAQ